MAFTNETLSHVGGSSPAPRIYTYYTNDSQATVTAANYFSEASTKLQVNDLIHIINTTLVYTVLVTAVSKKSVTIARSGITSAGYAIYEDSRATTLTLTADTLTVVHNNALGTNTTNAYLPLGVTNLWNAGTSSFDFSELSIGDAVEIRLLVQPTTASNNTEIELDLYLGSGLNQYKVPFITTQNFQFAGLFEATRYTSFPIRDEDTRTSPAQFKAIADKNCTLQTDDFFVKVTRNG
ncbi:MAG: hypothetical protein ACW968_14850 [Candidatus Thorarchaeota archaeon]|jgi:hypothetical protein